MPGSLGTDSRARWGRWRRLSGALLLVLALPALAACGDDGDPEVTERTPESASSDDGGDAEDAGDPVDLGDPCSLLSEDEAADIAGTPMPGEHTQTIDATAMFQGWADLLELDLDLEGDQAVCTRAAIEIDPSNPQEPPSGSAAISPTVVTLTKGTFSEEILLGNTEEDLSGELGLPAGLIVGGDLEQRTVTISMLVDDTHLAGVVGWVQGGDEQESRALVLEAAKRIAAKVS